MITTKKFVDVLVLAVSVAGFSVCAQAKTVGANVASQPLTVERIAKLPKAQQAAWLAYLKTSEETVKRDRAAFTAELKAAGIKDQPKLPKAGFAAHSMPLEKEASWYASADAVHIADTILSFQLPNGGWSKNLDMTQPARVPGESYLGDNGNKISAPGDFDAAKDLYWHYAGTVDNDATTTEVKFLRLVIAAAPEAASAKYRESYLKGVAYLLAAQFPNGGWPQVYPLEGGYHDNITYNDDAVTDAMEVLEPIGKGEVAFVPVATQKRAAAAVAKGLEIILKTQIVVNGKKTVWCQQHDPLTLEPASARNYEMPSEASGESASLLLYLMALPHPAAAVKDAVEGGVAWFRKTAIEGYTWGGTRTEGRHLIKGGGPIWARYYAIGTDMPIFGDRDKSIHDDVMEISAERRNGYAWYNGDGVKVFKAYDAWRAAQK